MHARTHIHACMHAYLYLIYIHGEGERKKERERERVYEDMHLKSPGINRKGRVLYPCPGFLVLHGLRYRKITILNVFINRLINQSIDIL